MKTVLVITDPISEMASVQFEVLKMFLRGMRTNYNILVATPYIPNKQISELKDSFNVNIHLLSSNKRIYQALLTRFKKNESMLWAISWLFEGLFSSNSIALKEKKLNVKDIINTSYTVPALCKIYWNQATPPMITLEQMAKSNLLAKFSLSLFGWIFSLLDRKVLKKHLESSKKIAHNSEYLMDLYAEYGVNSKVVIHSPKEFHDFIPSDISPSKDYVLAYIGKEVMVSTILKIADLGVKVRSFGAKVPYGTSVYELRERANYLGFVGEDELPNLYHNALFTIFPFTEEPFGWVPLESMHYGTPVLSYNKQGPSETIINGKTGWLVESEDELIAKALEIWETKQTGLSTEDCEDRVKSFSPQTTIKKLISLLEEPDEF